MERRACGREAADGGGSHCHSDLRRWSWERSLGSKEDGVAWLSSRGACQGRRRESQSTDEAFEPEPWAGERQRRM